MARSLAKLAETQSFDQPKVGAPARGCRSQSRGLERIVRNRVAVGDVWWTVTQGSSVLATVGFAMESRLNSKTTLIRLAFCQHGRHNCQQSNDSP